MNQNPFEENLKDVLKKYGRDIVEDAKNGKIDPIIGRDEEIRNITRILSRKTNQFTLNKSFIYHIFLAICLDNC